MTGDTDPVGSCHLDNDIDGGSIEVASVSPHHHSGPLAVAQIDGGEYTLDKVVKVVPLGLEHVHLLPEAAGAWSLVWVGGGGQSQNLQRTIHRFRRSQTQEHKVETGGTCCEGEIPFSGEEVQGGDRREKSLSHSQYFTCWERSSYGSQK